MPAKLPTHRPRHPGSVPCHRYSLPNRTGSNCRWRRCQHPTTLRSRVLRQTAGRRRPPLPQRFTHPTQCPPLSHHRAALYFLLDRIRPGTTAAQTQQNRPHARRDRRRRTSQTPGQRRKNQTCERSHSVIDEPTALEQLNRLSEYDGFHALKREAFRDLLHAIQVADTPQIASLVIDEIKAESTELPLSAHIRRRM